MSKPVLLDLFCGAGGAARGYQEAGFYVVGVDIKPQPRYAGDRFVQADALEVLRGLGPAELLLNYDAIHASPPCQGYSILRNLPWLKDKEYPMLIEETRLTLRSVGLPYVIENVMNAHMEAGWLCGQMFGLPAYRHRAFETSFYWLQPAHPKHTVVIGHGRRVNDRAKGTLNAGSNTGAWGKQSIVTVAGGQFRKADGERATGIDWMTVPELREAIPPAYTRYIGEQLMKVLKG